MMGGVRKSIGLIATCALILGTEAAVISDLSFNSEEIQTVEFMPLTLSEENPEEAAASNVIERTHDVLVFTLEDRDLLLRCAAAEGANQGEDGQWLILSVIMNRIADEDYPDNVHDVIYQPGHFCVVSDGRIETVKPTEATEMAMTRIEEGDIAPCIIAFEKHGNKVLEKWFEYAFTYRDHDFYTKKK